MNKVQKLSLDELQTKDLTSYDGILSIFAGSVFWETPKAFCDACEKGELADHSWDRLLELRAYNATSELHLQRDSIAADSQFTGRIVLDEDGLSDYSDFHFDDVQLLDVDENLSGSEELIATGGGRFTLPDCKMRRVKIRNYISYDNDEGMAQIVDFRIVELKEGTNNA